MNRIIKAAKTKEAFKVIVIMPLMPAFEAELDSPAGNTLR